MSSLELTYYKRLEVLAVPFRVVVSRTMPTTFIKAAVVLESSCCSTPLQPEGPYYPTRSVHQCRCSDGPRLGDLEFGSITEFGTTTSARINAESNGSRMLRYVDPTTVSLLFERPKELQNTFKLAFGWNEYDFMLGQQSMLGAVSDALYDPTSEWWA